MNERIDELMIQAGARFKFLDGIDYDNFQYKIFAELIIKECIKCCNDIDAFQKFYLKKGIDHELGASHCIEDIKEHFGVEFTPEIPDMTNEEIWTRLVGL